MENLKEYIDSLNVEDIPWNRMFTAYGTAQDYPKLLKVLEDMKDKEQTAQALSAISNYEHQSTMFLPAPFVTVFLVRILEKALQADDPLAESLVGSLIKTFTYHVMLCNDADAMEHAQPLSSLSDILDEKYLLPEDYSREDLDEIFESEDFLPEDLFYSLYYYTKSVISTVPYILDRYDKFQDMNINLKNLLS